MSHRSRPRPPESHAPVTSPADSNRVGGRSRGPGPYPVRRHAVSTCAERSCGCAALGAAVPGCTPAPVGCLAVGYYLAGKVGLELAYLDGAVAALWPPAGMGLAVLFLGGVHLWPGIVMGDLLLGEFSDAGERWR